MADTKKTVKKRTNKVSKKSNIKNDKKYIAFLLLAIVMFVIILISTVFGNLVQIYNNEKETEELMKRRTELLEEEASLNSEVIKLQDPDYIARYAREKYLYTKEGEKILTIIDTTEEAKEDSKESEQTESESKEE